MEFRTEAFVPINDVKVLETIYSVAFYHYVVF